MAEQSYSESEKSDGSDSQISEQEEEPYQAPQAQHVSRPTIGVKQPVSQQYRDHLTLQNQGASNELKTLQDSLEAQK